MSIIYFVTVTRFSWYLIIQCWCVYLFIRSLSKKKIREKKRPKPSNFITETMKVTILFIFLTFGECLITFLSLQLRLKSYFVNQRRQAFLTFSISLFPTLRSEMLIYRLNQSKRTKSSVTSPYATTLGKWNCRFFNNFYMKFDT